jgi:hypothetical protein
VAKSQKWEPHCSIVGSPFHNYPFSADTLSVAADGYEQICFASNDLLQTRTLLRLFLSWKLSRDSGLCISVLGIRQTKSKRPQTPISTLTSSE